MDFAQENIISWDFAAWRTWCCSIYVLYPNSKSSRLAVQTRRQQTWRQQEEHLTCGAIKKLNCVFYEWNVIIGRLDGEKALNTDQFKSVANILKGSSRYSGLTCPDFKIAAVCGVKKSPKHYIRLQKTRDTSIQVSLWACKHHSPNTIETGIRHITGMHKSM